MGDVESVSAVVDSNVEGILGAEEGISITFTRVVAEVAGPGVVGKPLEVVRETFIHAGDEFVVIAAAEAGEFEGAGERREGAVEGRRLAAENKYAIRGTSEASCSGVARGLENGAAELIGANGNKVALPI